MSNTDTIRMPYREIQQYNTLNILKHSTKMLPRFLYKVQPVFLVDSTILRRKYKDQPFNFTILNSSSMQYLHII